MPELQLLRADHAPMVLAFELANRAFFAASIPDRGDDYYAQFTQRHNGLLAEQQAGICACYVLVGEDGSVMGRFNLVDIEDGAAKLGYRVARRVAGRGVATATVRELCRLAASQYGLRMLRAARACRIARRGSRRNGAQHASSTSRGGRSSVLADMRTRPLRRRH
jgi:[ribosomal protein S5]-alanine N-acetyltransferase